MVMKCCEVFSEGICTFCRQCCSHNLFQRFNQAVAHYVKFRPGMLWDPKTENPFRVGNFLNVELRTSSVCNHYGKEEVVEGD